MRAPEKHWVMQDCNWASQCDENRSFAAIRQELCCDRQASAHGSALALPTAKADTARTASKALPTDFTDFTAA